MKKAAPSGVALLFAGREKNGILYDCVQKCRKTPG